MKLWLLRPIKPHADKGPWEPWYDKAFGFVVRAATEERARAVAQANGGDEIRAYNKSFTVRKELAAWTNPKWSSCEELTADGDEEMIMQDFHAA
jgi:hypothetical protein